MVQLEMYLDGKLIDRGIPGASLSQKKYAAHLKSLMAALEKKHEALLYDSGNDPVFIVSGVPSCMNSFVPLHLPQVSPSGTGLTDPAAGGPAVPAAAPLQKESAQTGVSLIPANAIRTKAVTAA